MIIKNQVFRQRLLLPAAFLMALSLGYYISAFQYSLLQIGAQFSFDSSQTGVIMGLNYGSHVFLPIIFGYFADRRGKKGFLIAACLLLLAGQFLLFFAGSYRALMLTTFVMGSGFGAMQTLYLSMLSDSFPGEATRYTNFAQTFYGIGAFFAPLVAAAIERQGLSWQSAFWPGIVILCVSILFLLFTQVQKMQPLSVGSPNRAERMAMFRSPLFYTILLWMVIYISVEVPTAANAKALFHQGLEAPEYSALALSLFWVMMVPSRLLMGLVKKNHGRISLMLSLLVALFTFAIAGTKNPLAVLVFFALSGFCCGPFWGTIFAASQKAFPQSTSTAGSFCGAFSGMSGFVFSVFFGAVGKSHSLAFVYSLIGVFSLALILVSLAYLLLLKKSGRPDA